MYNDILSIGKTIIECQSLDVVIFSLSLIGKNWQDYIIEAKRCLSTRGSLLIAVTTKEFRVCFMTSSVINYKALAEIHPELGQECYVSKEVQKKFFNIFCNFIIK